MDPLAIVRGWQAWLEQSGFAAHSRENYARPVLRFLAVSDPWNADLQALVTFCLSQPPRSAHITFSALRSFYGYAMAVGMLDTDPTANLRSPQKPNTIPRAFTRDELESLRLAALERDPRHAAAIDLLYATGARTAEACAVTEEDLLPDAVVFRKTKARPGGLRQERVVPLNRRALLAVEVFRTIPAGRDASQPTLMRVGNKSIYAWVHDAGRAAGIYARPHLLRATFATHLAEQGVDIRTIQDLLGHTNLTTTQRYLAVTDERRRAAIAALE